MGYVRYSHADVSATRPRALACCDRCGFVYNRDQLVWAVDWRGPQLQNLRILVCLTCYDLPQEQLRTIILPADPVPIENPRPGEYLQTPPDTPTIAITTPANNHTPSLTVASEMLPGDVIRLELATNSGFADPGFIAFNITSSTSLATITTSYIGKHTWYFQARVERSITMSGWSTVQSITITP